MNDEIKIKHELNILSNTILDDTTYKPTISRRKLLLDYITNLQQGNEEWAMIFDTFSKRPYAHRYLEEKRKELGNDKIIGLDSEMIYKDYYDYKSRIEKAVEYNKQIITDTKDFYRPTEDIIYSGNTIIDIATNNINILQNGSDDNG